MVGTLCLEEMIPYDICKEIKVDVLLPLPKLGDVIAYGSEIKGGVFSFKCVDVNKEV